MGTHPRPVDRTGYTQMSCYPRVSPGLVWEVSENPNWGLFTLQQCQSHGSPGRIGDVPD